jgi:hypothetical protein
LRWELNYLLLHEVRFDIIPRTLRIERLDWDPHDEASGFFGLVPLLRSHSDKKSVQKGNEKSEDNV